MEGPSSADDSEKLLSGEHKRTSVGLYYYYNNKCY
jgi:hypothetical protein